MLFDELKTTLQKLTGREEITQADIARALNASSAMINNRVKRGSEFKSQDLAQIEDFFGVKLSDVNDNEVITLEKIHIKPSCGSGTTLYEEASVTPIKLGRALIKEVLKVSDETNLKIFIASGDSMSPTIEDGDTLIVDTGRNDFANGGVFLITVNDDWFIKRLNLRFTGELEIISDNTRYDKQILTPDTQKSIVIRGRIVKNLSRGL